MHPLIASLSKLSDEELQKKHSDLMSKLNTAYRLGSYDMIRQLQMILENYRTESITRQEKQMLELQSKSKQFTNIIDIQ